MQTLRRASERGHARHDWLDSFHTFSFGDYQDPAHMGFRALRVINDDTVAPGRGFGSHSHTDMEIISVVIEGALAHRDSLGTGSVIRPGDVQRMTAGTGVVHSEMNASSSDPVHFLQIWLVPTQKGLSPSYEQRMFPAADRTGRLGLIASPSGRGGSIIVHSDASLYTGVFAAGQTTELPLTLGRYAWIHVVRGAVRVNGQELGAGDGLALTDESSVQVEGRGEGRGAGELFVFDLG
ncbi:MAG TPA: pirin family protein [Kofleriaceae bacterium]|nr:pirin family protein [Kofleriaceae bacterium]